MRNAIVGGGRGLVILAVLSLGICSWVAAEGDTCTVPDPGLREALSWHGVAPITGDPAQFPREAMEALGYLSWPPEYECKHCIARGSFSPATEGEGEGEWEGHHYEATPILDLTGLECASELSYLVLIDQPIDDFSPIAGLVKLETLGISTPTAIDVTDLAGLTALTFLQIHGAGVTDLSPLAGLTALIDVFLDGNNISDIRVLAGMPALRSLSLRNSQVTDISPLTNLGALQYLTLSGNQISDLSAVAGLSLLEILEANENPITVIPELPAPLRYLRLSECGLTSLHQVPAHATLEELTLYGNAISDLSGLSGFPELFSLDVGANGLESLETLPTNSMIEYLGLNYNTISDIAVLAQLPQLRHLFVHGNPLDPVTACPIFAVIRRNVGRVRADFDCRDTYHSGDTSFDLQFSLTELLRVIQFYNAGGYKQAHFSSLVTSEDGYEPYSRPGSGDAHHSADYDPVDWTINLAEIMRVIQLYNTGGYEACPGESEDGYRPVAQ
jgi:hypothetical protein